MNRRPDNGQNTGLPLLSLLVSWTLLIKLHGVVTQPRDSNVKQRNGTWPLETWKKNPINFYSSWCYGEVVSILACFTMSFANCDAFLPCWANSLRCNQSSQDVVLGFQFPNWKRNSNWLICWWLIFLGDWGAGQVLGVLMMMPTNNFVEIKLEIRSKLCILKFGEPRVIHQCWDTVMVKPLMNYFENCLSQFVNA